MCILYLDIYYQYCVLFRNKQIIRIVCKVFFQSNHKMICIYLYSGEMYYAIQFVSVDTFKQVIFVYSKYLLFLNKNKNYRI